MRLIDADALKKAIMEIKLISPSSVLLKGVFLRVLDEQPTIRSDEPRVMTLEEVLTANKPFFIEKPSNEDGDKEWRGWGVVDTEDREAGTIMFAVIGKSQRLLCDVETMGEYFRCWTARPTDEQRKAVKWDEIHD